jgi:hypothetical protein
MRLAIRLGLVLAVIGVIAAGLMPPVFARGQLDGYARDAAQKGAAIILNEGQGAAEALANQAATSHAGVQVVSMSVSPDGNTLSVTLSETVHTFMSTFHLQTTERSYLGG